MSGSYLNIPFGNLIYRLQYSNSAVLYLLPAVSDTTIIVDIKSSSQYDGGISASERDSYSLSGTLTIDSEIYGNSREMHRSWIRQQDPISGLWTLHEVDIFISGGSKRRVSVWLYEIYTGVDFSNL